MEKCGKENGSLPQASPLTYLLLLMTEDGLDDKAHEIMKSAIDVGVDAYYDKVDLW